MFSGIIDAVGIVRESWETAGGRVLRIEKPGYWQDLDSGASIAIDGVCLTMTRCDETTADFDVISETLRRTALGERKPGDDVNLQKSLAVGDRIDGHFVQGHVDAIGVVSRVEQSPKESKWWIRLGPDAMMYVTPKGSVAIDGISLTVADVGDDEFSVALIPTTLDRTTLGRKQPGAKVNIETDILTRTVVHYLSNIHGAPSRGRPKDDELLARHIAS